MSRQLTEEESRVLEMTWTHHGPQNTPESITWVKDGEATLWVRDGNRAMALLAYVTNSASWRLDGTIRTDSLSPPASKVVSSLFRELPRSQRRTGGAPRMNARGLPFNNNKQRTALSAATNAGR